MDWVGVEPTTSAHSILVPLAVNETISMSTNAAKRFSVVNLKRFANLLLTQLLLHFYHHSSIPGLSGLLFDKTRGEESHYSKIILSS